MKVHVFDTPEQLAAEAANRGVELLRKAVKDKGSARVMLSTGASQFGTIAALVASDMDWSKVEMFHLDEYVDLPESHPASFRKYLKERFTSKICLKKAHFVGWEGDLDQNIRALSDEIRKAPIDVGFIGIGENAHIAFNDPPADFDTTEAFIVVTLDDACRRQQTGEGWFPDVSAVPARAITASVHQIMQCRNIISCVPFAVKADAVRKTLSESVSNRVPASILRHHPDVAIFLDKASASLVDASLLAKFA